MPNTIENLQSLITVANATTGKSDPDLTAGVQSLIAGYGGGGGDTTQEDGLVSRTLTKYSNDRVTEVGDLVFSNYKVLKSARLPNAVTLGTNSFNGSGIETVNLPKVRTVNTNAFRFCEELRELILPSAVSGMSALDCAALVKADFGRADIISDTGIPQMAFRNDTSLVTLILRYNAPCVLANKNAFDGTPIASGTGYIYVPKALVEEYKAASNWVTYADQIRAIEDYPEITGGAK